MTNLAAVLYIALTLLAIRRVPWGRGMLLHPGVLFALSSTAYFIGTLAWIDPKDPVDIEYGVILFTAHACFVLGLIVSSAFWHTRPALMTKWYLKPLERIETSPRINLLILAIIITSIVACLLYYQAVGYNLFIESAISVLSGEGLLRHIPERRLYAYAGEFYFAPGYVNQFKNFLFPLLLVFLVARYMLLKRRRDSVMAFLLLPLCLVFILGTGQRFYIVFVTVIATVFFIAVVPKRTSRLPFIALLALATVLLLVGTFFLGRTVSDVTTTEDLARVVYEAVDRLTLSEPAGGLAGFHYIYDREIEWGREWKEKLLGLFPGQRLRSSIDNEIHRFIHGSERGTVSLNIWAESWYNFRMIGATVVPFLLASMCHAIFCLLIRGPKTLFRVLIFAAISVILGTWQMGGPDYLINQGLVTILILNFLVNWMAPYRTVTPAVRPSGGSLEPAAPPRRALARS